MLLLRRLVILVSCAWKFSYEYVGLVTVYSGHEERGHPGVTKTQQRYYGPGQHATMSIEEFSPASVFATDDPRVELTANAINWQTLMAVACPIHPIQLAYWRDQISGGYNLVRFLHIPKAQPDIVVVRVSLRPANQLTVECSEMLCSRIANEVATMQYIEAYTWFPVPHILHYSTEANGGGAGSPYIIMSKVEGIPLSSVWDEMEEGKCNVVFRQVVDIYLGPSSHRFDHIGALFRGEGFGKDA